MEDLPHYFHELEQYFNETLKKPLEIYLADELSVEYLNLPADKYVVTEVEDSRDYLYSAEALKKLEDGEKEYADEFSTVAALEKISSLEAPEQLSALKGKEVRFTQVTSKENMADVVFNMLGI